MIGFCLGYPAIIDPQANETTWEGHAVGLLFCFLGQGIHETHGNVAAAIECLVKSPPFDVSLKSVLLGTRGTSMLHVVGLAFQSIFPEIFRLF